MLDYLWEFLESNYCFGFLIKTLVEVCTDSVFFQVSWYCVEFFCNYYCFFWDLNKENVQNTFFSRSSVI